MVRDGRSNAFRARHPTADLPDRRSLDAPHLPVSSTATGPQHPARNSKIRSRVGSRAPGTLPRIVRPRRPGAAASSIDVSRSIELFYTRDPGGANAISRPCGHRRNSPPGARRSPPVAARRRAPCVSPGRTPDRSVRPLIRFPSRAACLRRRCVIRGERSYETGRFLTLDRQRSSCSASRRAPILTATSSAPSMQRSNHWPPTRAATAGPSPATRRSASGRSRAA